MQRTHALVVSVGVALTLAAGTFAATRTAHLGAASAAAKTSDAQIRERTKRLDRYAAKLRRAAKQRPPALPRLPALPPAPPPRPPIVVTLPATTQPAPVTAPTPRPERVAAPATTPHASAPAPMPVAPAAAPAPATIGSIQPQPPRVAGGEDGYDDSSGEDGGGDD